MNRKHLIILACMLTSLVLVVASPADEPWQKIVGDAHATISVERALYEKTGLPNFYLRVRITNLTDHPFGIDLRDHGWLIHINQWGPEDEDHRGEVNEETTIPKKLDAAMRQDLLQAFQAHKLTIIPAHGTFDYYINFGGEPPRSGYQESRA